MKIVWLIISILFTQIADAKVNKNKCYIEKTDLNIGRVGAKKTSDLDLLPKDRVDIKSIHYCLGRQNIPNSISVNVTDK